MSARLLALADLSRDTLSASAALARCIAQGLPVDSKAGDWRARACERLGMAFPPALPLAEWASPGAQLLATPIHFLAGLTTVHLHPGGPLGLAAAEWDDLAGSLCKSPLAGEVTLTRLGPSLAAVATPRSWSVLSHDPAPLAGCDPGPWLPTGEDGGLLRRLMTELQMWLHGHPVNQRREARGELAVNGFWLWGAAPGNEPSPIRALPTLHGDDAPMAGLWRRHSGPKRPLAASFEEWLAASREGDLAVLSVAPLGLEQAEARWFGPLQQVLARGACPDLEVWVQDRGWTLRPMSIAARLRRLWPLGRRA